MTFFLIFSGAKQSKFTDNIGYDEDKSNTCNASLVILSTKTNQFFSWKKVFFHKLTRMSNGSK